MQIILFTKNTNYTSPLFKYFIFLLQTCYPVRLEAVHFLYSSWIFDSAWCLIKPLLSETLTNRVYFHGDDLESFHTHINPKYLPKRYGGVHEEYPVNIWFDFILKNDKIIEEFINMGYEDIKLLAEDSRKADEGKINDKKG